MVNDSGSWAAADPEKNLFIATYESTTFDELVNAYDSGKVIVVKYNGTIYQLVSADTATSFVFMAVTDRLDTAVTASTITAVITYYFTKKETSE